MGLVGPLGTIGGIGGGGAPVIANLEKTGEKFKVSTFFVCTYIILHKVIIEKSRGEGSLMEQDTIEKVY